MAEVITLYVDNIGEPNEFGVIPITVWPLRKAAASKKHETILRMLAVNEVLSWVRERRQMAIGGALLFPADESGTKKIDPATVYRHVKHTFKRAGVDASRQGGRTLRNSFAASELASGKSLDVVQGYLGLFERKSVEKYELRSDQDADQRPAAITA